jgi:hypothetical protein
MKQFKFTLDKSSKKFVCPGCNKKTFVKYIDTESGEYLSDEYGRCDRETSCSFFNTPDGHQSKAFEVFDIPKPKTTFHSLELVEKSYLSKSKNNFIQFLHKIFSEVEVFEATQKYLIGTSARWSGATIFWQIDNFEQIHSGKILQYNSETGKRYKDENGKGLIDWVHSILKRNKTIQEFNLNQCLFGLHLINESKIKTIALVESEKTAVIMSLFKPEYTWLGTGSKGGLKYEFLKPIKEYKIVAFPDKTEYNDWFNKAIELNGFGFNIIISEWLEHTSYEPGTDLADVYIIEKMKL